MWHEKLSIMKQHIHITLVGGQRIPVFVGMPPKEEMDRLVMIHSNESLGDARKVAEVVGFEATEKLEFSSDDVSAMFEKAEEVFERFRNDRVTLNLTGGLKPWSWALQKAFAKHEDAEFIYVDQNNRVTNIATLEEREGLPISITQRFELNVMEIPRHRNLKDYTQEDIDSIARLEALQKHNYDVFRDLNQKYEKMNNRRRADEVRIKDNKGREHYLAWDKNEHWIEYSIFDKAGKELLEEFTSEHAFQIALNYGWFELRTAVELAKNEHAKEVWLDCVFKAQNGGDKNQIDVIADMGAKLVFVECKTMIHSISDLDKFSKAMRNYSGLGSKGIFVSYSEFNQKLWAEVCEKCHDSKLQYFNYFKWKKNRCAAEKSLNAVINRELYKQNSR